MFCENCGKQIPEGYEQCPECSPAPQPEAPPEEPGFDLNKPDLPAPGKKPVGKIILIAVAVVLVVAIVLTIVNWAAIVRFFKRTFMDPADYLVDLQTRNGAAAAAAFADVYGGMLEDMTVTGQPAVKTVLHVQIAPQTVAALETYLGGAVELGWLGQADITVTSNLQKTAYSLQTDIGINGSHVLGLSVIVDMETTDIYMTIPELNETYLVINYAQYSGVSVEEARQLLRVGAAVYDTMLTHMPEPEAVEAMINAYVGIVLEHITQVTKAERTLEVEGVEQELLVLTAEMDRDQVLTMLIDVLNYARCDETIKSLCRAMQEYMAADGSADPSRDLVAEFEKAIDEAIATMEKTMETPDESGFLLVWDVYLDDRDVMVGTTVTLENNEREERLHILALTDGEKVGAEAELGEMTVSGAGDLVDDLLTGSFLITMEGSDYAIVEFDSVGITEEGQTTGVLRILPESGMLTEWGLDDLMAGFAGGNLAISMDLGGEEPNLELQVGSVTMLALTMEQEPLEGWEIRLPEDAANFGNGTIPQSWLRDISFDTLIGNLEEAGLPAQYVTIVKMFAEAYAKEFQ